jgi:hypothetical protein
MLMRRRGAPLLRAAATTAVVAGTAGAVRHKQEQKWAAQQPPAPEPVAAPAAAPVPAPAPAGGGLDLAQLKQLADLHAAGILTDAEFTAAKAKLLA